MALTQSTVVAFLNSIERQEVILTPDKNPGEVYAGVVVYSASNGWQIAIFNDCNEWDYIEWIEAADGERVAFDELERMPQVTCYEPSAEVVGAVYKFPPKQPGGSSCLST